MSSKDYNKSNSIAKIIAGILLTIGFYATNPAINYISESRNYLNEFDLFNRRNIYSLSSINSFIYSYSILGIGGVLFSANSILIMITKMKI